MQIEKVQVTLQRTIRVPDGRQPAQLPPGLGNLPVYNVADYRANCPEIWEDGGVFVPMYEKEATWLNFRLSGSNPRALLIGAGNVNAITGKSLILKLATPQNYVVVPTQPWLDGWKDMDGVIYQFVAVEFKHGEGLTVGEQVLGEESRTGGIGIAVFAPVDKELSLHKPFHEFAISGPYWMPSAKSYSAPTMSLRSASFKELGLGRGGRIVQKIYPDPFGLDVWEGEPVATMAIYLVDVQSFEEITGKKAPSLPPAFGAYQGPYFALPDEEMGDTVGSGTFAGLKSVFAPNGQE